MIFDDNNDVPFRDPLAPADPVTPSSAATVAVPQDPPQGQEKPSSHPTLSPFVLAESSRIYDQAKAGEASADMARILRAAKADPRISAEAQRLGAKLGLEPDVVAANIDKARQAYREQKLANLQATDSYPTLRRMMLDQQFADVAAQDVDNLGTMEGLWNELKAGWLTAQQGLAWDKIRSGNYSAKEYKEALQATEDLLKLPTSSSGHGLWTPLYGAARQTGLYGNMAVDAAAVGASMAAAAFVIGQAGPQAFIPEEIVSMPGMFWAGFRATMMVESAAIEGGSTFQTLVQDYGLTPEEAKTTSTVVGLVNGALEYVGMGSVFGSAKRELGTMITKSAAKQLLEGGATRYATAKAIGRFAVHAVKNTLGEVTTEVLQEVSQIIGERYATSHADASHVDWEAVKSNQDLVDRIGGIIAETVRGTILMSSFGPALKLRREWQTIKNAKRMEVFLGDLRKGVDSTELHKNAPNMLAHFLADASDGSAVETLYVTKDEFDAALNQAGMSEEHLATIAPDLLKARKEGENTGFVALPTSELGARFLTSPFGERLSQDARVDPDGPSIKQMLESSAADQKRIVEEAAKIAEEREKAEPEFRKQLTEVHADMRDQLIAAGRPKEQASLQATFYGHLATIYSAHDKMPILDWHKTHGLSFVNEGAVVSGESLSQDAVNGGGGPQRVDERTGLPLNPDGTVTLYHHTNPQAAGEIASSKRLVSTKEPDVYLTTRKETDTGYGDTAVAVNVDPNSLQIDDEFPNGRRDFRISTGKVGGGVNISIPSAEVSGEKATSPKKVEAKSYASGGAVPAALPSWAVTKGFKVTEAQAKAAPSVSPKFELATDNYEKIDEVFRKVPNPLESEKSWRKFVSLLTGHNVVLGAPLQAIEYASNPQLIADYLRRMRPDQLASRREGFELGRKIREDYRNGTATATTTGRLIAWGMLSRSAGAFPHESAYMDLVNAGIDEWINRALLKEWTDADTAEFAAWSQKLMASRKGGVSPAAQVTSNANDIGQIMLRKMSMKDANGVSGLERFHKMLASGASTDAVRRFFFTLGDGLGVQNKVISFVLLVTGRVDTLVLDRVQISHLWGQSYEARARAAGVEPNGNGRVNIYDPPPGEHGRGGLAPVGEGHFGLAIYEALARGLSAAVREGYRLAGMEGFGDGELGAFHWDSWLVQSSQAIAHPTIEAISTPTPRADLSVRQGKFDTFGYGTRYRADGNYEVPLLSGGGSVVMSAADYNAFLKQVSDPKEGVVPKGFRVSSFTQSPWVDAPEVNRARYDQLVLSRGQPSGEALPAASPDVARSTTFQRTLRQQRAALAVHRYRSDLRSSQAEPWSHSRESGSGERSLRVLGHLGEGVRGTEWLIDPSFEKNLIDAGVTPRKVFELESSDSSASSYRSMIAAAKAGNQYGAAVHLYEVADYRQMRLFVSEDGRSGVAIKPNGDLVSAFSGGGNSMLYLMSIAVQQGAKMADSFDTILPYHYAPNGFRVVSRISWDDSQAPSGWDKKVFSPWNNGEPDVVFYAYDPKFVGIYSASEGQRFASYDDAVKAQAEQVKSIEESESGRPTTPEAPADSGLDSPNRRGSYYPTLRTAVLRADADATTVIHEMSHWAFLTMLRIAERPDASPQIRSDVEALIKWFGETSGKLGDVDTGAFDLISQFKALPTEVQTEFHEQLAYSFEVYAMEGKAPTPALATVFHRIRLWFIRAYQDIRRQLSAIFQENFDRELPALSDEVRGVFDRMVASQQAIEQGEAIRSMRPMYETREQFLAAGYSEEQWAGYQQALEEAHEQAVTDLTRASMSQMKWLRNARSRVLKAMQKGTRKIREAVRARVAEEVQQDPVYVTMEILRSSGATGKLNLEMMKWMLPDGEAREAAKKKLGVGKSGLLSTTGMPFDEVAEVAGFQSGEDMLQQLLAARPIDEVIEERTDETMMREHGELVDPAQIERGVEKALHSEARARFVAVELKFLSKSTQPTKLTLAVVKDVAQRTLGGMKLRNIRPDRLAQAEAANAKEAEKAASKPGKDKEAVEAKRRQLLNNVLTRLAIDAREMVDDTRAGWAKQLLRSQKTLSKTFNVELANTARWILSQFGLIRGPLTERTQNYMEMVQRYDPSLFGDVQKVMQWAVEVSSTLSQKSGGIRDYKDLTLDQFEQVTEAVEELLARASLDRTVLLRGERQAASDVAARLHTTIADKIPAQVAGEAGAYSKWDRFKARLFGTKANLTRVEHLFRAMDGGRDGEWMQSLFHALRESLSNCRVEAARHIRELVNVVRDLGLPSGTIDAPELGYVFGAGASGRGMSELMGLLSHMGNESNQAKALVAGRGEGNRWADVDPETGEVDFSRWYALRNRLVASGVLTQAHFDAVQAIWDRLEEIKPTLQAAHHELYGCYFKEVPAKGFSITFPDGTTKDYRGGYVPAVGDVDLMGTTQDPVTPDSLQSEWHNGLPRVEHGWSKERVENYRRRPLNLDISKIAAHIDQSIRFAHTQPRIRDVLKILGAKFDVLDENGEVVAQRALSDSLNRIDPTLIKDTLIPWLDRVATQSLYKTGGDPTANAFWRFIRVNNGVATMMGSVVNAAQQISGLSNAVIYIGVRRMFHGVSELLKQRGNLVDWVKQVSPFMRDRLENQVGTARADLHELLIDPSWLAQAQAWTTKKAYFLQALTQNLVDIATWKGAYERSMETRNEGETAEQHHHRAVLEADSIVRLSQGSFSAEDVAKYEVASPFLKTWFQFSGYFNNVLNSIGYSDKKVRATLLGFSLPMIIASAIGKLLLGDLGKKPDRPEDDDGLAWDAADIAILSQVKGSASLVPAWGPALSAFLQARLSRAPIGGDKVATSPAIATLYRSVDSLLATISVAARDDRDMTGRTIGDFLTGITVLSGLPVAPFGKPAKYLVDVGRGKIAPSGPVDFTRGLLTGRASNWSRR